MTFLIGFVLVKKSHAFIERPSQGTFSLASRLTTMSLDQENLSPFFFSVTENANKNIPVNLTNQWASYQRITQIGQTWEDLWIFETKYV